MQVEPIVFYDLPDDKAIPSESNVMLSKPLTTCGVNNRLNKRKDVLGVTIADTIFGTVSSSACASSAKSTASLSPSVTGPTPYVTLEDAVVSTLTTTTIIAQLAPVIIMS